MLLKKHARVIIDRVSYLTTHSKEAAKANGRSLLSDLAILQVSHQYLLKPTNGIIMSLN
jgi:hypothetical protein